MANSQHQRKKKAAPPPSIGQLVGDIKSLKKRLDDLRGTVAKHNDILQIQDNWHSRVSRWIGRQVHVDVDTGHSVDAKLLWTDRYNVGLEIDGAERLYNKGHIVWIGPA